MILNLHLAVLSLAGLASIYAILRYVVRNLSRKQPPIPAENFIDSMKTNEASLVKKPSSTNKPSFSSGATQSTCTRRNRGSSIDKYSYNPVDSSLSSSTLLSDTEGSSSIISGGGGDFSGGGSSGSWGSGSPSSSDSSGSSSSSDSSGSSF